MVEELTILDRHQGFHQIRRHLFQLDQHPVFLMGRVKPADQQRFEPRHRQIAATGLSQTRYIVTGEAHAHPLRGLGAFIELETARMQLDIIAGNRYAAGACHRTFAAIAQGIELRKEIFLAERLSDEQFQRACVNLGRDGPTRAGELLLHHGIEINGKACQHHEADQTELQSPA